MNTKFIILKKFRINKFKFCKEFMENFVNLNILVI